MAAKGAGAGPHARHRRSAVPRLRVSPASSVASMTELVVATFNLHAGVDGWGVPFDVESSCADLDADVIILQEVWTPTGGEGLATTVAKSLGYAVHEVTLSGAVLVEAASAPDSRWGPSSGDPLHTRGLWVGEPERLARRRWGPTAQTGAWGIALLSRLSVDLVEVIDLGNLRRDGSEKRAAIFSEIDVGSSSVTVVGTHLPHFTDGAWNLFERLRRRLPPTSRPAVFAGDMNFWGPPLSLALPGWRRAVRARTYPSWRPHSQIDHLFVTRPIEVISGQALRVGNSDHLALRARLAVS